MIQNNSAPCQSLFFILHFLFKVLEILYQVFSTEETVKSTQETQCLLLTLPNRKMISKIVGAQRRGYHGDNNFGHLFLDKQDSL